MVNWEKVINEMELPELSPPHPVFRKPTSDMGQQFNAQLMEAMKQASYMKRLMEQRILRGDPLTDFTKDTE